jgi:hypothetical protein
LPDSYTVVPAVALNKTQETVPEVSHDISSFESKIELARDQESNWLRHAFSTNKSTSIQFSFLEPTFNFAKVTP